VLGGPENDRVSGGGNDCGRGQTLAVADLE
jgi:hypothetical protein